MKKGGQQGDIFFLVPAAIAVLSFVFVVVPLGEMFFRIDSQTLSDVFADGGVGTVIKQSVMASLYTTIISVRLASVLAWGVERTAIRRKKIISVAVSLPMLIPSVSIGMGIIQLFGNNGLLTDDLMLPAGYIYGLPGIVLSSVIYTMPVAFQMMRSTMKFEDASPYEAATVLGISKWHQFWSITIPYMKKPMISVLFSVFTMSFTDYGVPLMIGGKYKTLPVMMYQDVIGQLNFSKGCVYGGMLLAPAVIAFLVDLSNKNMEKSGFITRKFIIKNSRWRDTAVQLFSVCISVLCLMPIAAFLVLAFAKQYPVDMSLSMKNILYVIKAGGQRYLVNSIVISVCTALLGTAVAVLAAYITARNTGVLSKYLHLMCISIAAIPGIVLGLAYVLMFKNTALYGTIWILIIVNTVHFFASPYLMIYTAFSKINKNLEAVASTLGIGRINLLTDIMLPMCRYTIVEMLSYFFVNSMMTISAVSFLTGIKTKPVALMINQFEAQAQIEYAAVVSFLIFAVNLAVKVIAEWIVVHKKE